MCHWSRSSEKREGRGATLAPALPGDGEAHACTFVWLVLRCDVCIKCCGTAGEGEANSGGEERHRGGVSLSRALKDG